jgi:hypothetical protein
VNDGPEIDPLLLEAADAQSSREISAIVVMHDELDEPGI